MAINADILRSKFGFNDPNVIQGILNDPGQVARYEREYSQSSGGSGSYGSGNTDYNSILAQTTEAQRKAAEPAIQSLQSSIPEIRSQYSTRQSQLTSQKDPLAQRYDNLLQSIVQEQSTATSREYGKRGIPLSSGMFDEALLAKTQPIRQQIGTEKISALQDLESQITNLGTEATSQERAVKNAIAQLQAGAGSDAITNALNLLQLQQQQRQFDTTASATSSSDWQTITAGGRVYSYNPKTGEKRDMGASSSGTGSKPIIIGGDQTKSSNTTVPTASPNFVAVNGGIGASSPNLTQAVSALLPKTSGLNLGLGLPGLDILSLLGLKK